MMKIIEEIRYVIGLRAFWLIFAAIYGIGILRSVMFGIPTAVDFVFNLIALAIALWLFTVSKSHTDK